MMLSRRVLWAGRAVCAAAVCVMALSAAQADVITHTFGSGDNVFTMDFVHVGDAGNDAASADNTEHGESAAYGYGAVPYAYQIGKYAVSVNQWNAAKAAGADLSDGGARWSDDQPMGDVSWYNAAEFTNWLTSGDKDIGVYDTSATGWGSSTAADYTGITERGSSQWNQLLADHGTVYFLPTGDEWYKAAYYDPDKPDSWEEGYYLYGTGSDDTPTAESPPGTTEYNGEAGANSANYGASSPTDVGAYVNATSPYGAYDMAGGVWEWTETLHPDPQYFRIRGGSYVTSEDFLRASSTAGGDPTNQYYALGFRVASIPEPAGATMFLTGAVGLLFWRRRRNA